MVPGFGRYTEMDDQLPDIDFIAKASELLSGEGAGHGYLPSFFFRR